MSTQPELELNTNPNAAGMRKIDIVLDATMFDTFQLCAQRFHNRFNLNKVTDLQDKPLDKGGLIHVGLEYYYKALKDKQGFTESLRIGVDEFDRATVKSDLLPDEIRHIRNVVVENITHWRATDERREIIGVEIPFSYLLHEDDTVRIVMIGKIDLITTDDKYSNLPTDHKSYERAFPLRRMTNQFCNYANAMNSSYLEVNRVGLQTSLKPFEKHKRVPLSYDPLFLEQWKQNTIKECYRYLDCVTENSWPMNLTSCDKFNKQCPYYEVCDSSGEPAKLWKLQANFKTSEPWDVAKSLGLSKD